MVYYQHFQVTAHYGYPHPSSPFSPLQYHWSQEITSNPPSGCIPGQMLCCLWRGEAWPINPCSERLAAGLVLQMLLTSAAAGQPQIPQLETGGSSKVGKSSFLGGLGIELLMPGRWMREILWEILWERQWCCYYLGISNPIMQCLGCGCDSQG